MFHECSSFCWGIASSWKRSTEVRGNNLGAAQHVYFYFNYVCTPEFPDKVDGCSMITCSIIAHIS